MLISELQTYSLSYKASKAFSGSSSGDGSFAFITEKGLDILAGVRKTILLQWLICLLLLTSQSFVLADDATNQIFGDRTDGLPAAFGDFNSDELTDIFVVRDSAHSLEVLLAQDKEPSLYTSGIGCKFKSQITSVVPGDFNGDALMDVMVTLHAGGSVLDVVLLWGEMTKLNCSEKALFQTKGQPLALDYNKDMVMDLFGVDTSGERSFWIFNNTKGFKQHEMPRFSNYNSSIRVPHSNAILDLDGDDLADLYITTEENFEIWKGKDSSGFHPFTTIDLPVNVKNNKHNYIIGQTTFLDVELEGKLDHLVPVCLDASCSESKIFVYSNGSWHNLEIDFKEPGTGDVWHFPTDSSIPYLNTITLRPGDFNMDGFPDLLVTLASKKTPHNFKSFFLENVDCKKCSGFSRTFAVQWDKLNNYNNNTVLGVFFDFLQDGVLDIIFVHNKDSMYNVSAYRNTENYDANFVKVMVVTGLTNSEHPLVAGPLRRKSASVYGTNLPGPKVYYETTTQEGDPRTAVATQIPQSAHYSLNLPYTIFGLGRTPNFIDSLTVQVYGKHRTWNQLIPNSQMVVIPWPVENSNYWRVQLFVTPSKLIFQSVLALLATCIVIAFIIGALYWKERKEDHLERLQEAHRFHFDAM